MPRVPWPWEDQPEPEPEPDEATKQRAAFPVKLPAGAYTPPGHVSVRESKDRMMGNAVRGGLSHERADQIVSEALRKAIVKRIR